MHALIPTNLINSREVVTEFSVDVDVTLHIETDSELDEEVKRMKETVDETIKPSDLVSDTFKEIIQQLQPDTVSYFI